MKKYLFLISFLIILLLFCFSNKLLGYNLSEADTLTPIPIYDFCYCCGYASGTVVDLPNDSIIRSNLAFIRFHTDSSYNYSFTYNPIVPGISTVSNWSLSTVDASKDAKAIITFSDMNANDTTIFIEYYAPDVIINMNSEVDFGELMVNEIVKKEIQIENHSNKRVIVLSGIKRKSNNNNLNIIGIDLPYKLEPQNKITLMLEFVATNAGTYIDTLLFTDTCGIHYSAILKAVVNTISDIYYSNNEFKNIISISPIPANEIINVKLNLLNNEPISMILYDHYGKIVQSLFKSEINPIDISDININFSSISSGIYYLMVKQGIHREIKKIEIIK